MYANVAMEHTIHQHVMILTNVLLKHIIVILMLIVITYEIQENILVLVNLATLAMVFSVRKLTYA